MPSPHNIIKHCYNRYVITYVALWDPESTKFQCYLRPSPRHWRILIHFNVVLTVFTLTTYLRVCAKLSELHFDASLFSNRGEKVLKRHITMGQIWDRFSGSSPHNWRIMTHWNVFLTVLNTPWDMWSMWEIVETTLKCINVLQLRGKGPKYHWNLVDSGSQSPTYENFQASKMHFVAVDKFLQAVDCHISLDLSAGDKSWPNLLSGQREGLANLWWLAQLWP